MLTLQKSESSKKASLLLNSISYLTIVVATIALSTANAQMFGTNANGGASQNGLGSLGALGGNGGLTGGGVINGTGGAGLGATNANAAGAVVANEPLMQNSNPLQKTYPMTPLKQNEFQKFILETSGFKLPLFGLDFFENLQTNYSVRGMETPSLSLTSGAFAPLDNSPVNDDYAVGPGDQIVVRGWGSLTVDIKLTVDRNGQLSIPKIGSLNVAGVKASKLESVIKTAFSKYYKDFELSVTLGQLRSITVYVVGQARRPGSYFLSSLSTLASGLFATGGPNSNGSMRRVQLKRGGQVITEFDLYKFLTEGVSTSDVKLIDGDVIYIPPAFGYVAIVGKVNTPAVFELKSNDESLEQILKIAGGLPVVADPKKVTLERLDSSKKQTRSVEDFPLDSNGLHKTLKNGDLLTILTITPELSNAITLRGSVAQPIRVAWREGVRISDLIPNREALISRDSIRRQNETLFDSNQRERALREREMIPGDLLDDAELTARVNKINLEASLSNKPNNTNFTSLSNALVLECQNEPNQLKCKDVRDVESLRAYREGRLFKDQAINLDNNLKQTQTLTDRIGNLYDEINWDYAVIERLKRSDLSVTLIPFNLNNVLNDQKDPDNQLLQPGDVITIFSTNDLSVPISKRRITVRVEGEISKPGVYQAKPGDTLSTIIQRAGGLTHDAYLYGAAFYRDEVRRSQLENLQKLIKRVEAESNAALLQASQSTGASSNPIAVQARVLAAQAAQKQAMDRIRNLKPEGRIALTQSPDLYNRIETLPEIRLQNGDRLVIPTRPDFVYIYGAVNTESALLYRSEQTVNDYLKLSGVTASADKNTAILLRANGSALTNTGSWSNTVLSTKVMPGDSIVIPDKLDLETTWSSAIRNTVDITQIFYQLGLGAAAIKVLHP